MRVSTADQTTENQAHDLKQMAQQRDLAIVEQYIDHGMWNSFAATRSRPNDGRCSKRKVRHRTGLGL
jgi:DNA invertase Pin-like site-specific DNA recombinase